MLPFDNKSEFQVMVDHPEGTPLEVTLETARQMTAYLAHAVPEVADVQLYAGNAAPFNFNGLVRHYFLRRMAHAADLQVNLVAKDERDAQSHDIAKRVRPALVEIAKRRGARVKVVEIPPGPPVMDTMVAEIYGPTQAGRASEVARQVRGLFETTPGVVDVHDSLEAERDRVLVSLDREKAGLKGIPAAAAVETLAGPGAGRDVARLDAPSSREPVPVRVRLSAADRASRERRLSLRVDSPLGGQVALGELARVESRAGAAAARAQGPQAGGLRHGRPRRREGEPGLRDPRAQREARRAEAARRRQRRAALDRGPGDLGAAWR